MSALGPRVLVPDTVCTKQERFPKKDDKTQHHHAISFAYLGDTYTHFYKTEADWREACTKCTIGQPYDLLIPCSLKGFGFNPDAAPDIHPGGSITIGRRAAAADPLAASSVGARRAA